MTMQNCTTTRILIKHDTSLKSESAANPFPFTCLGLNYNGAMLVELGKKDFGRPKHASPAVDISKCFSFFLHLSIISSAAVYSFLLRNTIVPPPSGGPLLYLLHPLQPVSWTSRNPGRKFFGCKSYGNNGCNFFDLVDKEKTIQEEMKEIYNQIRHVAVQKEDWRAIAEGVKDLNNRLLKGIKRERKKREEVQRKYEQCKKSLKCARNMIYLLNGILTAVAEAPGPANDAPASTLVLAEKRTKRPDILDNFCRYQGGWDIANKHYCVTEAAMIVGAREAGVSPIVGSFPQKEAALVKQLFTAVDHHPWINLPSIHQV
ncbi:hypothetical protein LguiA_023108 [Lonicera macranthoides]